MGTWWKTPANFINLAEIYLPEKTLFLRSLQKIFSSRSKKIFFWSSQFLQTVFGFHRELPDLNLAWTSSNVTSVCWTSSTVGWETSSTAGSTDVSWSCSTSLASSASPSCSSAASSDSSVSSFWSKYPDALILAIASERFLSAVESRRQLQN